MYKAIIVDDEAKACHVLKSLIEEIDLDIFISHVINYPVDAIEIINENKPDLLFLDIDMPYMSGFDILEKLNDIELEIIFVTGHNEYAINAFKFAASGYVLKPIDLDDLRNTIETSIKRIAIKKSQEHNLVLLENLSSKQDKKIGIPTMEGLDFVSTSKIIRCETIMKCTKVMIEDQPHILSSYNIGEFVRMLLPFNFISVHKSHLINLEKISKYYKDGTITMTDGSIVPLARRRKQDFLKRITKVS